MTAITPPDLHGRERERADLDALVRAAAASRSGVRVLVGEPGAGKTALLDYAATRAGGFTVLAARGVPSESRLPFAALHRLVRPLTPLVDGLPEPQRRALAVALGRAEGPAPDRFLISVAVLSLLSEAAERGPVLAVADDAHWMDAPSLDALAFAAARLEAEGVALLAARRPDHPPVFQGLPTAQVGGLEAEAAGRLVRERARGPVGEAVCARLVAHTGGNPLALREIVDGLTPDQLAGRTALPRPLPVGPGLERAYLDRVAALPEDTRTLLLLAAVESEIDAATLVRAAAHARIDVSAIEAAEAAGLVQLSEAGVRFRHPLMRSAVHQGAGLTRRRWAHQVLAETSGPPDRRSWHRAAAALEPDAGLAAELEATAVRARVRSGYAAAAVALERAAELTPAAAQRGRRLVAAAWDRWQAGHTDLAVHLLDRAGRPTGADADAGSARPSGDDPGLPAPERTGDTAPERAAGPGEPEETGDPDEIAFLSGVIGLRVGATGTAYESLLSAARLPDPARALRALMGAAEAASYAGDLVRLATAARRAGSLGDTPGTRAALMRAYLAALAEAASGDLPRAVGPLRQVVDAAGLVADPDALGWAGTAALMLGDDEAAHALSSRAVALARARGAVTAVPQALELLVYSELWTGRLGMAGANALEGLRLATDTGQLNCVCHLHALLALHAAIEGDEHACRERAQAALARAREHRIGLAAAVATWALAFSDLSAGRYGQAAQRLTRMSRADAGLGHGAITLLSAPHYVEAAVRDGDRERAARALEAFRTWAETVGSPWARALVERCRALLAPERDAGEHYLAALELHARGERDFERARTALLYGAYLRHRRHREEARDHLREAAEVFERLGAARWRQRAAAELRAAGEPVSGPGSSIGEVLTAQQLQIARFVAEGATNREIAARLFVSPRTVDYHVRNIFTKLGITSRAELIRSAASSLTAPGG
ncbi:LuxR C-terminal-related transcriptional regulator [Streptosporangium sp. NPDC004379]|uniref:helix-turn-helix transcriptional regulator n=1 Tax=Streptosporangium sp. NPDC004379 TaxID=3366189 RepID=UPI0036A5C1D9